MSRNPAAWRGFASSPAAANGDSIGARRLPLRSEWSGQLRWTPLVSIALLWLTLVCPVPCQAIRVSGTDMPEAAKTPVLRSAWMLASSQISLPPRPRTAEEEQAQLRRHFLAVEKILVRDTPTSLRVATKRLERALGQTLNAADRERLMGLLGERRLGQIDRIRQYRERNRFPLNSDPGASPRPIFVDEHGTQCAVGYLMWRSGEPAKVAEIAQADNFVVLSDVRQGPFIAWVLQSGLLHEEAALIQPAYAPPAQYLGPLSDFLQGGATERDGVRYDNFTFYSTQVGAAAVNPNDMQLIADLSDITSYPFPQMSFGFFHPSGTNFLALHGQLGTTSGTQSILWRIGFDVSAINPTKAISAAYLSSNQYHMRTGAGNGSPSMIPLHGPDGSLLFNPGGHAPWLDLYFDGYAEFQSRLSTDGQPLGDIAVGSSNLEDYLLNNPRLLDVSRGLSFAPVHKLHVDTQLILAGNAFSTDIAHEFTLVTVPEPSGGTLLVLVALTATMFSPRKYWLLLRPALGASPGRRLSIH